MSNMPWFQFYPADWLSGTRTLSASETGIYITLIATMYDKREPLKLEPDRLARLCGSTVKKFTEALAKLISEGKIVEGENGLWNDRVAEQLHIFDSKSEKARKANEYRWKNKNEQKQASDRPFGVRSDGRGNPNQNHKERRGKIGEVKKGDDVQIEQGSEPFKAWEKHLGKSLPAVTMRINGKLTQGWYVPTEYPPSREAA